MRTGLLLLLLIAGVACASPGRFVIVDVALNGLPQTPVMIFVAAAGDILARRDDIAGWTLDVSGIPMEAIQNIAHIRLAAIPGVTVQLHATVLTINAEESAFQGTRIDLQKTSAPNLDTGTGVYVNYDLTFVGGRGQRPAAAAATEAVYFVDAFSFASTGVVSSVRSERQFIRHESNLQWDDPARALTLVAGDAIGRSGTLARGFRFGGISIGNNFATRPELVTFALPAVPGESRIPSTAELLINGQTHSRFDLAPGPFEISNVPAINGAGEIQLLTRDALGRQQVLVVPYYVSPALLRPGLIDTGLEMGKVREDFGLANFHYGRGFAKGILRRGINSGLTVEGFLETTGGQHAIGGGATAALGHLAVFSTGIILSEDGRHGNSFSASLERSARGFSLGLRGQVASRYFTQLGEIAGLRYRLNANAGFSFGSLGNLSLVHVAESRYDRGRIATNALSHQLQLGKTLSLLSTFSTARTAEGMRQFAGLALTLPLDALASASLSSTRQNGSKEHVLEVRENLPTDDGWATRARVTSGAGRGARIDAGLTLQNQIGQWSADISHARDQENMRLGMNGSLVMAGSTARAVRQIGDAFAIVSVPGQPGIDVYYENQRVAQTDAFGFAIVPRLRPFEANAIRLDTLKLALTTELSTPQRTATPGRRAGVLLRFKATSTHGALVRMVKENGEPVPAGALLSIRGETFPVAANGEAWVTGLAADTDAIVTWRDQLCALRIPLPDAANARPRIGPLTCKSGGA